VSKAPDLLVSDADRERVAGQLREHYEAGRLTLEEFQERLDEVHAARTESALADVLRQLPTVTPLPSVRPGDRRWRSLAVQYAFVNLVALLVWAVSGAETDNFWPKWVLLGTLILFGRRMMGPRHRHDWRQLPPSPPPPPEPPER
jgi:hypothetical protein